MPEMPEVQALVDFLDARTVGRAIEKVTVASISALKTYAPPPDALVGRTIDAVHRHGKYLDIVAGDLHLVFHLARAGWLRFTDDLPATPLKPTKSPIALRVRLDDGSGFDLTEAGTKKSLAVWVVAAPTEIERLASLGPDPLDPAFDLDAFRGILSGRRSQIKGVLRDQSTIAGIGNAYSDEILHAARLSPFAIAANLDADTVERLYSAMLETLRDAVTEAAGKPPADLKDAKRRGMSVHGRSGQACPVCGDTVRDVHYADSSLQYCPTCQTGGKPLADRILSRLLK